MNVTTLLALIAERFDKQFPELIRPVEFRIKKLKNGNLTTEEMKGAVSQKHEVTMFLGWVVAETLDTVSKIMPKDKPDDIIRELGSEFSTPRDYRRAGYKQALDDVQKALDGFRNVHDPKCTAMRRLITPGGKTLCISCSLTKGIPPVEI